jgi:hypothetical protein
VAWLTSELFLLSFDIRNTQLGSYHAQLELNFGMIRTLTPA